MQTACFLRILADTRYLLDTGCLEICDCAPLSELKFQEMLKGRPTKRGVLYVCVEQREGKAFD